MTPPRTPPSHAHLRRHALGDARARAHRKRWRARGRTNGATSQPSKPRSLTQACPGGRGGPNVMSCAQGQATEPQATLAYASMPLGCGQPSTSTTQKGGGALHPSTKPEREHRMLSMPSRHPKLTRSSRGNRARAPPPRIQTCVQRGRALQHATLTRGPPRNALVRMAWCDAPTYELKHAHARSAPKRIRTNSTCRSLLRNEFRHANILLLRRVRVACLQGTRRGRVSPPCRAKPPRTRRSRGGGTTRTNTKSAREAPGKPQKPSRRLEPT